MERDENFNTT
jgi:hypothetical protein